MRRSATRRFAPPPEKPHSAGQWRDWPAKIALTAGGNAALLEVDAVLQDEWAAAGFNDCFVREADPEIYGPGAVAAYTDQPV